MQNKKYLYSGTVVCIVLASIVMAFLIIKSNKSSNTMLPTGVQKEISINEVANHNSPNDCWVYIGGQVFNATAVIAQNESQKSILSSVCGGDGTSIYTVQKYSEQELSRTDILKLREQLNSYQIGLLTP